MDNLEQLDMQGTKTPQNKMQHYGLHFETTQKSSNTNISATSQRKGKPPLYRQEWGSMGAHHVANQNLNG